MWNLKRGRKWKCLEFKVRTVFIIIRIGFFLLLLFNYFVHFDKFAKGHKENITNSVLYIYDEEF